MNLLPVVIAIIAVFAGLFLGWHIHSLIVRVEQLEKKNDESENKITELKEIANRRKLPYPAQAGIEDVIAIAIDIINENEATQAYTNTRLDQLKERLIKVRSNPQGYDTNQPDGQTRKKGK